MCVLRVTANPATRPLEALVRHCPGSSQQHVGENFRLRHLLRSARQHSVLFVPGEPARRCATRRLRLTMAACARRGHRNTPLPPNASSPADPNNGCGRRPGKSSSACGDRRVSVAKSNRHPQSPPQFWEPASGLRNEPRRASGAARTMAEVMSATAPDRARRTGGATRRRAEHPASSFRRTGKRSTIRSSTSTFAPTAYRQPLRRNRPS